MVDDGGRVLFCVSKGVAGGCKQSAGLARRASKWSRCGNKAVLTHTRSPSHGLVEHNMALVVLTNRSGARIVQPLQVLSTCYPW